MRRLRLSRLTLAAIAAGLLIVAGAVAGVVASRGSGEEPRKDADTTAADAHPVAGHFEPDETELEACDDSDRACLEQAFGNVAYTEGPERALELFDQAMARDQQIEANCHRIAHTIGSAALAKLEGNVSEAFARGSASCWSGYYHGILERSFTGVSSRDEMGKVARELCSDLQEGSTTFLLYQCVHGLGHGLMIRSGYDLPFSLSICDRLTTEWDQTSCTGGVFMENISSSYGVQSKWLRDGDGTYPCPVMKERHKLYCYLMVTSRINELNGFDWSKTAATCARVEGDWVSTCFESYGRDASGSTRQDPVQVEKLCRLAVQHAVSCVYGAARDMTSNYANGERASELCRRVERPLRTQCYYGIGTILGNLATTAAERRRACRDVTPAPYLASCLSGTGERVSGVVEPS
jgi:hypothetical protein